MTVHCVDESCLCPAVEARRVSYRTQHRRRARSSLFAGCTVITAEVDPFVFFVLWTREQDIHSRIRELDGPGLTLAASYTQFVGYYVTRDAAYAAVKSIQATESLNPRLYTGRLYILVRVPRALVESLYAAPGYLRRQVPTRVEISEDPV